MKASEITITIPSTIIIPFLRGKHTIEVDLHEVANPAKVVETLLPFARNAIADSGASLDKNTSDADRMTLYRKTLARMLNGSYGFRMGSDEVLKVLRVSAKARGIRLPDGTVVSALKPKEQTYETLQAAFGDAWEDTLEMAKAMVGEVDLS